MPLFLLVEIYILLKFLSTSMCSKCVCVWVCAKIICQIKPKTCSNEQILVRNEQNLEWFSVSQSHFHAPNANAHFESIINALWEKCVVPFTGTTRTAFLFSIAICRSIYARKENSQTKMTKNIQQEMIPTLVLCPHTSISISTPSLRLQIAFLKLNLLIHFSSASIITSSILTKKHN